MTKKGLSGRGGLLGEGEVDEDEEGEAASRDNCVARFMANCMIRRATAESLLASCTRAEANLGGQVAARSAWQAGASGWAGTRWYLEICEGGRG